MYAPVEMRQPERKRLRYVYIKMIRANVDAQEGKLQRGDVLVVDEDKALRYVYRARIARPATLIEFENYQARRRRTQQGSRRLRNQPIALPSPDENPFEYVEESDPGWEDAENRNQEQMAPEWESERDVGQPRTLGDQLETFGQASDDDDDDTDDTTDDDTIDEDSEDEAVPGMYDEGYDPNDETPGVYDQSISRGPGEVHVSAEEEEKRRPRGRRRGR